MCSSAPTHIHVDVVCSTVTGQVFASCISLFQYTLMPYTLLLQYTFKACLSMFENTFVYCLLFRCTFTACVLLFQCAFTFVSLFPCTLTSCVLLFWQIFISYVRLFQYTSACCFSNIPTHSRQVFRCSSTWHAMLLSTISEHIYTMCSTAPVHVHVIFSTVPVHIHAMRCIVPVHRRVPVFLYTFTSYVPLF